MDYDSRDPRLLRLLGEDINSMNEEEALKFISDIREDRKITKKPPIKVRRERTASTKVKKNLESIIKAMSPEEKKKFLSSLK